ncbi:MAG: class I SAM-dependent methyltransferase [Anaerolineae bacterium]|nr:class I SAM-dependent methyltransferase [Anaerolineae bacterium]
MTQPDLLTQQIDYYRARAGEYDEWFLRQGRYDHGQAHNQQWFAEVAKIERLLVEFGPGGHMLELACGTGLWTQRLESFATTLTAVDSSPEMIALNRARVASDKILYVQASIFDWQPDRQFDVVFFSFWLSHVPPEKFEAFWKFVAGCLAPAGRVFFVDSLYNPASTARNHSLRTPQDTAVTRRLNDGRTFEIVKVFYDPPQLTRHLQALGWAVEVTQTENFFLAGWSKSAHKNVLLKVLTFSFLRNSGIT